MSMLAGQVGQALSLAKTNRIRKTTDIRQHVLLEPAGESDFFVVCSDDTTETQIRVDGVLKHSMAIAPEFCDLVQTLGDDTQIKLSDPAKSSVRIQIGKSRFTLPTAIAADFPRFQVEAAQTTTTVEVDASVFGEALSLAKCGMARPDPAKLYTHGILLTVKKNAMFLVATNGQKMAVAAINATSDAGHEERSGVLPEMAIVQLERLISAAAGKQTRMRLELGERQLVATMGSAVLRTRLVACQYPDWAKVTATKVDGSIEVSRAVMLSVLKRVGLFVTDKEPWVTLNAAEGKLSISHGNVQGECSESMDIATTKPLTANVNIGYLVALLESMPVNQVNLDFGAILRARAASDHVNALSIAALYKV